MKATLIIVTVDLQIKFVSGHGTVVQPACTNIVFGYPQAQQYNEHVNFVRAVSCSAQNAESHWSHVYITLIVEHINYHAV